MQPEGVADGGLPYVGVGLLLASVPPAVVPESESLVVILERAAYDG
jgi:hypothetical protein